MCVFISILPRILFTYYVSVITACTMSNKLLHEMLKVVPICMTHFSQLAVKCVFTCLSSSTVILEKNVLILLAFQWSNNLMLIIHTNTHIHIHIHTYTDILINLNFNKFCISYFAHYIKNTRTNELSST